MWRRQYIYERAVPAAGDGLRRGAHNRAIETSRICQRVGHRFAQVEVAERGQASICRHGRAARAGDAWLAPCARGVFAHDQVGQRRATDDIAGRVG